MPEPQVHNTKVTSIVRAYRAITADDNGEAPSRLMLVQAGEWPDSVKGNLTITTADLIEMKNNFDVGIARPGQGLGLPIDFAHNEWDQAAGWINELLVDGDALYSINTEWSDAGKQAIVGKMFKCVSPSFYPRGRGGWEDPEDLSHNVENVIVGAGLTNIPFFKGLSAVKASTLSEEDADDKIIYINQSAKEETPDMTLDDVRVKAQADLTKDEEKLLADHRSELTAEELTKFGLEKTPVNASVVDGVKLTEEESKILADIRDGKSKVVAADQAVVDASELTRLKESSEQYRLEKASTTVDEHVKRGAIKADQAERWTNRLLASAGNARKELEDDLKSLPSNEALGQELGNSEDVPINADARAQIAEMAGKLVADAKAKGEELDYVTAQNQILAANPDLAEQDRKQNKFTA